MQKELISSDHIPYLIIPAFSGDAEHLLKIRINGRDFTELMLSCSETLQFNSAIRLPLKPGDRITLSGTFPAAFLELFTLSPVRPESGQSLPFIHYAPDFGWCNDPNGLIFQDGSFHFCHQFNPCSTAWNNMSWGYTESRDLLHWTRTETLMLPDSEGSMFSGCAIRNEYSLLGLPENAIIYFYTAAGNHLSRYPEETSWSSGKPFVQCYAYSLDGGKTIIKPENNTVIGDLGCDARDPKVFPDRKTGLYHLVLYLSEDRYRICQSANLRDWTVTQELRFPNSWECPDLFPLTTDRSRTFWVFWTADGYYYLGQFDGTRFHTDLVRHQAYRTALPYAAQTFFGTPGRIITVPWLRTKNHGRTYTGMFGLPMELSLKETENGPVLCQTPVKEYFDHRKKEAVHTGVKTAAVLTAEAALELDIRTDIPQDLSCSLCGTEISYCTASGILTVNNEQTYLAPGLRDFQLFADRGVLEILSDSGKLYAAFDAGLNLLKGTVSVHAASPVTAELFTLT